MSKKKYKGDPIKLMKELAVKNSNYQYSLTELENVMNVAIQAYRAMFKSFTPDGYNYDWYRAFTHGICVAMWQQCDDKEDEEELRAIFTFAKHAWTNQKEKMWKYDDDEEEETNSQPV